MAFAAASWLWLLGPWTAVAIWLIWSRRHGSPARVPFVALWRGTTPAHASVRRIAVLPLAVVAILLAILLAILGAAQPHLGKKTAAAVTVIVDRGITMSPAGRRAEVLELARQALPADASATFLAVPEIDISTWSAAAEAPATCVDTATALRRSAAAALARTDGPVIVLTDQNVRSDERLVRIAPTRAAANAGIRRFALREHPTTQAMVTVRSDSATSRAQLLVGAARQAIDLPPAGQEASYFIDLPAVERTLEARLEIADDFDGDNVAYLARQRAWPKIEVRGNVAPEVRRVIEAYRTARPASEGSAAVAVVESADMLRSDQAGVIAPLAASRAPGAVTFRPHPITANLDPARWTDLVSAPPASGAGWDAIILTDRQPLLSVRETPARQVWIAFAAPGVAQSSEFVILWTNIFDWLAGAAPASEPFAAADVGTLGSEWRPRSGRDLWPGIYQRSDGAIAAANAPAVDLPAAQQSAPPPQEIRAAIAALTAQSRRGFDLSRYCFVAAGAFILLAAAASPGEILTRFSPARTV